MDIPRLSALNRQWRRLPPPALQLTRIAAALGVKHEEAPAPAHPPALPASEEQAARLLETFPTQPAQPYMSAEEYLRRRAEREGKHGQ